MPTSSRENGLMWASAPTKYELISNSSRKQPKTQKGDAYEKATIGTFSDTDTHMLHGTSYYGGRDGEHSLENHIRKSHRQ